MLAQFVVIQYVPLLSNNVGHQFFISGAVFTRHYHGLSHAGVL